MYSILKCIIAKTLLQNIKLPYEEKYEAIADWLVLKVSILENSFCVNANPTGKLYFLVNFNSAWVVRWGSTVSNSSSECRWLGPVFTEYDVGDEVDVVVLRYT